MKISPKIKLAIIAIIVCVLVSLVMGFIIGFNDFFALPGVVMAVIFYQTGVRSIDRAQKKGNE